MTDNRLKMLVSAVCGAAMTLGVSAQAKPVCNTPSEVSAVQIRQLQIQMMVSTLRCDSSTYDFRGHYAGFLENVNPLMPSNLKQIKSMLARQKGGDFDHYLTLMSIDAQNLSQQDPDYCGRAVRILEQVSALGSPSEVPGVAAQSVPSPFKVVACADEPPALEAKKKRHSTKTAAN